MNKYLKYFIIIFVVIFSNFIVFNDSSSDNLNETTIDPDTVLKSELKENNKVEEFIIATYPEEQTATVSHKLDSVFKRFNKRNDFHGSILVAKKGKVLFSKDYGFADFKKKTTIEKESVFQLASVSKQFTAAAIMILKERNLLQLNDTVTKYYPNFPYKDVTIHHLLNHTAGLPNYFWIAEHKWEKEKAPSNGEMMEMLENHNVNRFFSAGRKFDYSNSGYFVLASIIENVSGVSYGDFLKTNIFDPLQMKDSYAYSFEKDSIKTNQLAGYRMYKWRYHIEIKGTVNDGVVGDKNVYSTTEDLFKWINGLNNGEIISKESLAMMYSKGKTKYGREVPYGFGFRIDNRNEEKTIYHYGKWNGFSTAITQFTDSDLLVIALEHSSYQSMTHLNKTVKKIVFDNFEEEDSQVELEVSNIDSSESM